ncbi:hypothetical protein [Marimonas arenosa]|uniref:Uncharacterized protein n=1 Tax=Marimonas arenosa TaxID=1795305 RepID=A0AAE4B5P6_9RHOB|nr:hypothetical protein [Marimonas arenosa]MDQ2089481.1 hypothetical protein [Marimonas arenosa]
MPLALDDPAWGTLPDAYGHTETGQRIARLTEQWDAEEANDLFWSCLCHQDTLYPATFAALPHIVALGGDLTGKPRRDIAGFLGYVGHVAQQPIHVCGGMFDTPWTENPAQWKNKGLESILPEALALFPRIAELEEIAFLEEEDESAYHHAAGFLAAHGFDDLASFILCRENGSFVCDSCGRLHEWILFGDRIAYYDDVSQNDYGGMIVEDVSLIDWKQGAPDHAAGFAVPRVLSDPALDCLRVLLAKRADPITAALARFWRSGIGCATCDWTGELS